MTVDKILLKKPTGAGSVLQFAILAQTWYGLEVYGNTFPSYLDKLTVLNNKLLRILQNKDHT